MNSDLPLNSLRQREFRIRENNNYDVIVVESIERAYSRISLVQPDVVVLFMNIDDVDGCQLLSMLHMDRGLRGVKVVACTTGPEASDTHRLRDFEERCDTRVPVAG